ncbi:MAG: hypothetical protein H7326_09820 [Bdellovibrionaceae bacterium]|nr:hypothetical protein [Pseudobdellovibrionaceae bacterium]
MNFTASQKKWALTASLATVLSFNLVMSLGHQDFGSGSFASHEEDRLEDEARGKRDADAIRDRIETSKRDKAVTNREGVLKMRDVEINDQKEQVLLVKEGTKTRAIISKTNTEGEMCNTCGGSRLLPVAFDSDLGDIRSALKKSLKDTPAEEDSKSIDKDIADLRNQDRKNAKKKDKDEEEDGKIALKKLSDECRNKKFHADREDRITCFADGLTAVLSKDLTFDKSAVFKLFSAEVGAPLMDFLKLNPNSDRHTFAIETVNKMASELPEDANYLRQALTRMNAKVVRDAEVEVQNKVTQYRQMDQLAKQNPSNIGLRQQAALLGSVIDQEQFKVNQLGNSLGVNLKSGFESAIASDYMTPTLASQYLNVDYFGQVNSIIKGFENSVKTNTTYTIPNIDLSGGTSVTLADGTTLIINQANKTNGNNLVTTTTNGTRLQYIPTTNLSPIQAGVPMITSNGGQNTATITVVSAPVGGSQNFTGTRSAQIPTIRGNN